MAAIPAPRRKRGGLRRGTLTPDRIVAESLRLLDTGGVAGFSMPKLGRALGADPTAVYRHFASKDDLVLAIADQLIEEAMTGLVAGLDRLGYITRKPLRSSRVIEAEVTPLGLKVHNEGKAVVSAGSRESMEVDVSKLHAAGLWATMQQDR